MGKYRPPDGTTTTTTTTPNPWKIYKDTAGYWYAHNPTTDVYKYFDGTKQAVTEAPGYTADDLDLTLWKDLNAAGITNLKAGAGTTYPEWTPTSTTTTKTTNPTWVDTPGDDLLLTDEQLTKDAKPAINVDPNEMTAANLKKWSPDVPEETSVAKDEFEKNLDATYKRNMLLYGLGIPMQLRALLQRVPEVPPIPYTHYRSPQTVSGVAPEMSALNQALGTSYGLASSLGKYGNSGLLMMPGAIADTLGAGITGRQEIDAAEIERLNTQEAANVDAINKTGEAKTTAEVQRLSLQGSANESVQTQKAAAAGNIQDILGLMANQGTAKIDAQNLHDYYQKLATQAMYDKIVESMGLKGDA